MTEDMRGLFFVMKGQYSKGVEPSFTNKVTSDTMYIGGYDPFNTDTKEWYGVYDTRTYHCISCGCSLEKVLKGVYNTIKKYKGDAKKYFKFVDDSLSSGNRPKVSPTMKHLHEKVFEEYGDYYRDEVREMEDLAYSELKEEKPLNKTRKLMKKTSKGVEIETPVKTEVVEVTPKKVKPKVRLGLKKLSME